jgi:hypothetical protein
MSNELFPMPQRAYWSWTWPIKRSPVFKNINQKPTNNIGFTHIGLTPFAIYAYELDVSFIKGYGNKIDSVYMSRFSTSVPSAYHAVVGFYAARHGSFSTFLFDDPTDDGIDDSGNPIMYDAGTGDGSSVIFQTTRVGIEGSDLIQFFPVAPSVFVDGTLQNISMDYTLDQYGTLVFNTAPTEGQSVQWAGKFYFRAHFTEDQLSSLQEDLHGIWSIKTLSFETEMI